MHRGTFDDELLACEDIESCKEAKSIVKESKLRRSALELFNVVKGTLSANELRLQQVVHFLERVRSGFFDKDLLAHNATSNWLEAGFVKKNIGSILLASRTHASHPRVETGEGRSRQRQENFGKEGSGVAK